MQRPACKGAQRRRHAGELGVGAADHDPEQALRDVLAPLAHHRRVDECDGLFGRGGGEPGDRVRVHGRQDRHRETGAGRLQDAPRPGEHLLALRVVLDAHEHRVGDGRNLGRVAGWVGPGGRSLPDRRRPHVVHRDPVADAGDVFVDLGTDDPEADQADRPGLGQRIAGLLRSVGHGREATEVADHEHCEHSVTAS